MMKNTKIKNSYRKLRSSVSVASVFDDLFLSLIVIVIVIISMFPLPSMGKPSPALSIRQFLALAEKNDPFFERVLKDKEKQGYWIDLGLPSRQVVVSILNEYALASGNNKNTSKLVAGIEKEILETGTSIEISHQKTKDQTDKKTDVSEIKVEQSLWKNFLGRDVRAKKSLLEEEVEIIRLEVLDSYEEYLVKILKLYLDFRKAYIDLELAQNAHQEAGRLKDNVLARMKKSVATQADVNKSELQKLLREEELLEIKKKFNSQWLEIKNIIGEMSDCKPEEENFHPDTIKPETVKQQPIEENRRMQILRLKESVLTKEVLLAKRLDDPELSLMGGYRQSDSQLLSTKTERDEALIGFKVSVPIGDTKSKAVSKSVILEHAKIKLDLRIAEKNHQTLINDLKSNLHELITILNLGRRKVEVAEKIMKYEEQRYQYGKIDLDRLIEMRNSLIKYRFDYQRDLLEYKKIYLEWLSLNDQLLDFKDKL